MVAHTNVKLATQLWPPVLQVLGVETDGAVCVEPFVLCGFVVLRPFV